MPGLVREPDAGNPPVRFDERGVETERQPPRHSSTLLPPFSPNILDQSIQQLLLELPVGLMASNLR